MAALLSPGRAAFGPLPPRRLHPAGAAEPFGVGAAGQLLGGRELGLAQDHRQIEARIRPGLPPGPGAKGHQGEHIGFGAVPRQGLAAGVWIQAGAQHHRQGQRPRLPPGDLRRAEGLGDGGGHGFHPTGCNQARKAAGLRSSGKGLNDGGCRRKLGVGLPASTSKVETRPLGSSTTRIRPGGPSARRCRRAGRERGEWVFAPPFDGLPVSQQSRFCRERHR